LRVVLEHLVSGEPHIEQYKDHSLYGNYAGALECYFEPDLVLIYAIVGDDLRMLPTGARADLFKK
jgi:mRNA interferase YafQ